MKARLHVPGRRPGEDQLDGTIVELPAAPRVDDSLEVELPTGGEVSYRVHHVSWLLRVDPSTSPGVVASDPVLYVVLRHLAG